MQFDSGTTKRETQPTSRRAYFSSRRVLIFSPQFRFNLDPHELTLAAPPRHNSSSSEGKMDHAAHQHRRAITYSHAVLELSEAFLSITVKRLTLDLL